jgi:D-tagatose-1,6-bisphosphate aldolase subunit GatZ/KbaZ
MSSHLLATVERHKSGRAVGVYSVCSAHPLVLEAAMLQALEDGTYLLVEATSNQVDQFGGYTGMRPADFRDLVHAIASEHGLSKDRVVLGGDHLGPNRWHALPAEQAMTHADALIEAYVAAGFTKIHLDCSMACAGDPTPLTDAIVAARAARLAKVAEQTAIRMDGASSLLYVVGTEVPVPGGAHETLTVLTPTSADSARATLAAHQAAFDEQGIHDAWGRVLALVVQPGVEFDHLQVIDYDRSRTDDLRRVLDDRPNLVFEAHSTDYQTPANLRALVEDHWAVLKVGPGLTFALREALFALAHIEQELVEESDRSHLPEVVEERMLAQPAHWHDYYTGDSSSQRLARRYSYSDRLRYYWPDPEIQASQEQLFSNLTGRDIPLPLLSQYLPDQYVRVRRGELTAEPRSLVVDRVRDALRPYSQACTPAADQGRS